MALKNTHTSSMNGSAQPDKQNLSVNKSSYNKRFGSRDTRGSHVEGVPELKVTAQNSHYENINGTTPKGSQVGSTYFG